ncbi:hypothetical protein CYJ66_01470 [Gardnerella vaginalis]|nr:hypothetical protein CYJ66_01470 [Gardnerella vaginalis]PKZ55576.1 hypothetical protein CYJ64_01470 [Gardnerella vaginalis]
MILLIYTLLIYSLFITLFFANVLKAIFKADSFYTNGALRRCSASKRRDLSSFKTNQALYNNKVNIKYNINDNFKKIFANTLTHFFNKIARSE